MPISLHLHENFLGFHLQDAHNASLKIQYVFWAVSPLPRSKGMKILRFGGVGGRFLEKTVDFFWRDGILFVHLHRQNRNSDFIRSECRVPLTRG